MKNWFWIIDKILSCIWGIRLLEIHWNFVDLFNLSGCGEILSINTSFLYITPSTLLHPAVYLLFLPTIKISFFKSRKETLFLGFFSSRDHTLNLRHIENFERRSRHTYKLAPALQYYFADNFLITLAPNKRKQIISIVLPSLAVKSHSFEGNFLFINPRMWNPIPCRVKKNFGGGPGT